MSNKRYQIIISGRVQGVAFRHNALQKANEFGITGWIKNRLDGKVESVIEGEELAAKQMLAWLKGGPTHADVIDTEIKEYPYNGDFNSFRLY